MILRSVQNITFFPLLISIILFENVFIGIASSEQDSWFSRLSDKYPLGMANIITNYEKNDSLFSEAAYNILGGTTNNLRRILKAKCAQITQPIIPDFVPFPCSLKEMRSTSRPSSVHAIRPGDVDVIAALGDSLTAGLAALATHALELLDENRSVTAFIGGLGTWREFTTLPNLLKEVNPRLYGFSYGDGPSGSDEAGFNLAESGSVSRYLYHEVQMLVAKMKKDIRVDFQQDWKLITIAIGTNNFCSDSCWVKNFTENIEGHRQDLIRTFRYLRDNVPRTIVNLMQTIGIQYLTRKEFPGVQCTLLNRVSCHCLTSLQHAIVDSIYARRKYHFLDVARKWQQVDREVYELAEFRDRDDFTILLQPMLTDMFVPTSRDLDTGREVVDLTYWAPDCFHYSQKMNSKLAVAAWNSLFTPDAVKSTNAFNISESFLCPAERNPYICTWKSSK